MLRKAFHGDTSLLRKPVKMPNGFMKADAFFTRTGVFSYTKRDGSVVKELRLPEEVFKADSMKSFENLSVTMGHPREAVTADNAQRYGVGHSGEGIVRDGNKMRGSIIVTDSSTIRQMKRGTREISNGYFCDLEDSPGVTRGIEGIADGLSYDCIQRNIQGNHIAIVDRGRAGSDVKARVDAIHFDSEEDIEFSVSDFHVDSEDSEPCTQYAADAYAALRRRDDEMLHLVGFVAWPIIMEMGLTISEVASALVVGENEAEHILSGDVMPTGKQLNGLAELLGVPANDLKAMLPERQREQLTDGEDKMDFEIILDGIAYKFKSEASAKQALEKYQKDSQAKIDSLVADAAKADAAAEEASAKLDAADKEVVALTAKLDAAQEPSAIRKRIDARVALETSAKEILGDKFVTADSDEDLQKAVILAVSPEAKLDGKSEVYVEARFDSALEIFAANKKVPEKKKSHSETRKAANDAAKQDGDKDIVQDARDASAKRNAEAWKQPLSASK